MSNNSDQPASTAVLATWCDSPDHLNLPPRKVQTWLAEGDHAGIVRAAAGPSGAVAGSTANEASAAAAARRVRFDQGDADAHEQATARRRSVNKALEEYYKVCVCVAHMYIEDFY